MIGRSIDRARERARHVVGIAEAQDQTAPRFEHASELSKNGRKFGPEVDCVRGQHAINACRRYRQPIGVTQPDVGTACGDGVRVEPTRHPDHRRRRIDPDNTAGPEALGDAADRVAVRTRRRVLSLGSDLPKAIVRSLPAAVSERITRPTSQPTRPRGRAD